MKVKSFKRKTFRRKRVLPKSPVFEMCDFPKLMILDELLDTSDITQKEYEKTKGLLKHGELTDGEANELIEWLKERQRNPILGGFYYQAKDITEMLSRLK